MPAAWTPLIATSLSSAASIVTIGSIPQGYRDLSLVIQFNDVPAYNDAFCKINNDSTINYRWIRLYGSGNSTGSSTEETGLGIPIVYTENADGGMAIFQVLDYASTAKQKVTVSRAGGSGYSVSELICARYSTNNAVTELVINAYSNSFPAGTTFNLYGSTKL